MWLNTAGVSLDESMHIFLDFYGNYVDILTDVDEVSLECVGLD